MRARKRYLRTILYNSLRKKWGSKGESNTLENYLCKTKNSISIKNSKSLLKKHKIFINNKLINAGLSKLNSGDLITFNLKNLPLNSILTILRKQIISKKKTRRFSRINKNNFNLFLKRQKKIFSSLTSFSDKKNSFRKKFFNKLKKVPVIKEKILIKKN
jgi:hypothetical protein